MEYKSVKNKAMGVGSLVAGIFLCLIGGVMVLIFGSILLGFSVAGLISGGKILIFLLLTVGSAVLLLMGINRCIIYSFAQKVKGIMAEKSREKLALIGEVTKRKNTRLVRDLRKIAGMGYFPRAYVDLYRREFVVIPGRPVAPITPGPTMLREVSRKSSLPIYSIAAIWLLWAFTMPMYRITDFIIIAAVSVVLYIVLGRVIPSHNIIVEEARKAEPVKKPEAINTGNTELDEVLTMAMKYMNKLAVLDASITAGEIDNTVQELVVVCKQMFDYIKKTPKKIPQIRTFLNYYLPTTIDLLENYDELSRQPVKGDNIKSAMKKIEDSMQAILKAFQKELDNLYQDKALNIEVDIEVLQNVMNQNGMDIDK